jgi:hypothetical protein
MKRFDISVILNHSDMFHVDLTAHDFIEGPRPHRVFSGRDEFNAALLDLGLSHETIFDIRCDLGREQKAVCRDVDIEDDAVKDFEEVNR